VKYPFPIPRRSELHDDHRLVVLYDSTQDLTDHRLCRIAASGIFALMHADEIEGLALEIVNDRLLDYQVTRKPVHKLDHDSLDAVECGKNFFWFRQGVKFPKD